MEPYHRQRSRSDGELGLERICNDHPPPQYPGLVESAPIRRRHGTKADFTSVPCLMEGYSPEPDISLLKEAKKLARKEKLQKEYEEARNARKLGRRRKWTSGEVRSQSSKLMRNIAGVWQSLFVTKTYIVVNQQGTTFRFSESKSLFLFDQNSRLRQNCINLFIRPMFSHFIMLVILANCFCMMQAEPPEWIETHLEYVFTAIYCFEALVKIIGRGFVLHRFAYLRDPWNWLDFLVIFFAILTQILEEAMPDDSDLGQFSVLRAFRVLRALKTMSVVPGLRGIVKALLGSIRALQDAVALTIFCVSVFALIGYQLFHGTLRNKCVRIPGYIEDGPDALYLADWNSPYYATYLYENPYFESNTTLNSSQNSIFRTSLTHKFDNKNISLPFSLTPLFSYQPFGDSQKETWTHFYHDPWVESDTNLTMDVFTKMNELLKNANSNVSHSLRATSCSDYLKECIANANFRVQTNSASSLVRAMLRNQNDLASALDSTGCENPHISTSSAPFTTKPYTTEPSTAFTSLFNSSTVVEPKCNVFIMAVAGNISCMYESLGINISNESATDHQCYDENIWIQTMAYGEKSVERWRTRKTMLFFKLHPFLNESNPFSGNLSEIFQHTKSHLIFEEYGRQNMTEREVEEWDCNDEHYIMRELDTGMYFYKNSSNRLSPEPLFCKIGDKTTCAPFHECREVGGNPDKGYTNFDSFFWAFLTSFRLINQDAWGRLFYLTLHTIGSSYVIFYIIVMFLGSYYLINLILAVVYMAYEDQQAADEDEALEEEEHKAERREMEASLSEEERSKEDDIGSHSSLRSFNALEEGLTHRVGYITTSLNSIADSAISRRSRSRYGHRKPPVKVDPESEYLYRQYTKRYGDGMSRSGRNSRCGSRRVRSRLNSDASACSSENNSYSKSNSSHSHYCSRCRGRMQRQPAQEHDNNLQVKVVITSDTPVTTPDDNMLYPDLASRKTPEPVDKTLKNSMMDVLAVDFAPGRSPSIYSTGSEGNFDLDNDVFVKSGNNIHGDSSNWLKPIPGSIPANDRSALLVVPYDRASQSTISVSSNSDVIDGGEQVVQADVNTAVYHLDPPPSYTESLIGSQTSNSLIKETPKSVEQPRPPLPLQVPSLMVTSASTEHILGLKELQTRRLSLDSTCDNKSGLCKPSLPSILGSPSGNLENEISAFETRSEISRMSSRRRRSRRSSRRGSKKASRNRPDHSSSTNNSNVRSCYNLHDETKSHRSFHADRDRDPQEVPLVKGFPDSARLTTIAANMEKIEDDSRVSNMSCKKCVQWYLRRMKKGSVKIFCKWSCCTPGWARFQRLVRCLVLDPFMDLLITLCIFLNTVFMMLEYYPEDPDHNAMLETANYVFTTVFAGEMLLKVIGLSPHTYFREAWNVFDAVVVISSLLEIVLKSIPGLTVLRAFRLMRILKLAKSWPTLNKLLRIIGKTLGKLWHLTIVFLLVLFIFAVVGMQLLRGSYKTYYEGKILPRWNFVDFQHAFMVVFRIQCGEWIENMFTCMEVANPGICITLFILVLVIGNLVILNLFLALLLNSFSGDALQRVDAQRNSIAEAWARIVRWARKGARAVTRCDVLSNCCAKLRLQICYGKNNVDNKNGRIKTQNKDKTVEFSKTESTALGNLNSEVPTTTDAVENNNHTTIIIDHEKTKPKPKINSVADEHLVNNRRNRNRYFGKDDEIISSSGDDRRSSSRRNNPNCRSCHKNHLPCPDGSNQKADAISINGSPKDIMTCRGCHRTFRTPRAQRARRKARMKDGFMPAPAFQNRPDDAVDDVIHNNANDEMGLQPRKAFQAYENIEYRRGGSQRRTKSEDSKHPDPENSKSHKRSRHSSGGSDSKNRTNTQMSYLTTVAGKDSKPSEEEETDTLLNIGNSTSDSKRKKYNDGILSYRKKSNASVRSSRTSGSHGHPDVRSRSVSAVSSEAEPEVENAAKKIKKKEIQQCFPPCWTNDTEGTFWKVRLLFHKVAVHRYFEHIVIFCILASSVALAFEDIYLDQKPALKNALKILDKFFCIFFAVEMLIKWIGFGIRYYFTNAWCLLDFVIVFISLVDLFMSLTGGSNDQLATLRVLRTFRALRPLRALSRFQGMKVVVDALVRAIPSIFHVFMVCVIVWLIFSILGVNLFGGRFGRCVMRNGTTGVIMPRRNETQTWNATEMCSRKIPQPLKEEDLIPVRNKTECEECIKVMGMGDESIMTWFVPPINFDNVGQGFLSLMQVATFKGWLEIMANAVDITGIDEQPEYESSFYFYIYFCIFIVFGAFFSLNLFIGVIIDNFNQQKTKCSEGEDSVFLTDEQKRYYNAMKRMASKAPSNPVPRPTNFIANKIYSLVTDRKFEIGVMVMIILNMIVMAIEHYNMSEELDHVLQNLNLAFICIFFVEAVLKLIGLRLYYFTFLWNIFDIVVVIVSIIASALSEMIEKYFVQPTLFRIIRLFRVTRILRLIREAKGIRTLLFALMMSLPALFNIGSLLFLVIFIYAILGMSQFAYVKKIAGIDDLLNFETFPNSFLVLFQVSTSEGWNTFIEPILHDKAPLCNRSIPNSSENGNCGNSAFGIPYFVTFVMITFLIVINMYIAIILENFEVATRESAEPLTADDFEQFFEVWQRFDDKLTQYITFEQLQHFLHQLDVPLRVPFPNRAFIVNARMKITKTGRVHCLEVIIALIKKVLGDSPELHAFKGTMVEMFTTKCKTKNIPDEEESMDTVEFERRRRCAIVIQRAFRNWKYGKEEDGDDDMSDDESSYSRSDFEPN